MRPTRSIILAALALSLSSTVEAQQPTPPPVAVAPAPPAQAPALSPKQRAALAQQEAELTRAARQVIAMIDANQAGEVWDGASATIKRLVPREEFIRQVGIDRSRMGAPGARGTPVVTRSRFKAGGQVPQGQYVNIATPTNFETAAQPVRELVSFRLDEDRVWRVSGYSLR